MTPVPLNNFIMEPAIVSASYIGALRMYPSYNPSEIRRIKSAIDLALSSAQANDSLPIQ